mgnify:CR=1 FL=1
MARFVLERQEKLLGKIQEQEDLINHHIVPRKPSSEFREGQLSVFGWSRRNIGWMFDDDEMEEKV